MKNRAHIYICGLHEVNKKKSFEPTCKCAAATAELGIIFVAAVARLHNQLTVGKVGIVAAVGLHLQVLHPQHGGVLRLVVPIAPAARVRAGVGGLGPINGERVVGAKDLHPRVLPQIRVVLAPADRRPGVAVYLAGNEHVGAHGVTCVRHSDAHSNVAGSGLVRRQCC